MSQNKKKDKSFNPFFVLIFLVVFYISGYYIGTNSFPEQVKDKRNTADDKEVLYGGDEEIIVRLMNQLTSGMDCWNIEEFAKDKKVTSQDLTNERIFQVVQDSSLLPENVESISLEDLEKEIKKYFANPLFNPLKINYQGKECFSYSYDSSSMMFHKQETSCGGSCGPNSSRYQITSAVEKNNELKVYIKVLFGSQAEDVKFYSDYERMNYVTDDYEHLDEYYEKGSSYLFTFKKVDGYYVFVSSELL